MLAGVEADLVVCGHTHHQFERTIAGVRIVNAGSVGLPYEGLRGRSGHCSGPKSSSAAPATTSTRRCRSSSTRGSRRRIGSSAPPSASRSRRPRESPGTSRSAREELRPRGPEARRPEARAHPARDRAPRRRAPGRDDRAPLLDPARAPDLGDALGADDRREREPRHRAALPRVPAGRGLPRGAAGGARAPHLRHGLLPSEGRSIQGTRASSWRSSTARCRRGSTTSSICPASAARPRTRRAEPGQCARGSRSSMHDRRPAALHPRGKAARWRSKRDADHHARRLGSRVVRPALAAGLQRTACRTAVHRGGLLCRRAAASRTRYREKPLRVHVHVDPGFAEDLDTRFGVGLELQALAGTIGLPSLRGGS